MQNLKVLVVDDSLLSQKVILQKLQEDGADVIQAISAVEALELLNELAFDCVYVDYEMPEMNGLELIKRIHKLELNPRPALTLLTSHSSEEVYQQAMDAGADAYILKGQSVFYPTIHMSDLVKKIEAEQAINEEVGRQNKNTGKATMLGLDVLVVDDSLLSRKLLTKELEEEGAKVQQVSSGIDALKLLERKSFKCIYIDYEMPRMSGLELVAAIRKLNLDPQPALTILTAHDSADVYEPAIKAGADAFLSKGQNVYFPTIHVLDLINKLEAESIINEEVQLRKSIEIDLLKAKEKAEAETHAKSDFLANMSHEIRTPMNGVLGMAQILQKSNLDSSQQEHINILLNSSNALLAVLNDILDFSKIEAGKLNIESIPFDLHVCIEETCDLLLPKVVEKNLELIYRIMPDVPRHVIGDPGRVRQILTNYIGNAVKFTAEGHVLVQVECSKQEDDTDWIKYSVVDTGIGIPKDKQELIFDKFTQADGSTTREFGGSGLGLSICQQLALLLKGKIGLESSPKVGSTFWFEIPMLRDSNQEGSVPVNLNAELGGRRLLYVDYSEINQRVFKEHFHGTGAEIKVCSSALEAFKAMDASVAAGKAYEILVSEHRMQKFSGLNLIESIHKRYPDLCLRLIMLTNTPEKGEAEQMRGAGFHAYLPKPARRKVLNQVVKILLNTPEDQLSSTFLTRHNIKEFNGDHEEVAVMPVIKKKILLAEDNFINQKVAIKMLEKIGADVQVACDGKIAVDMFLKGDYDLIFMDCMMPNLDGYEATRAIRQSDHPRSKEVGIVAMTAHSLKGNREDCLNAGMNDYISKPFMFDRLKEVVENWDAPK